MGHMSEPRSGGSAAESSGGAARGHSRRRPIVAGNWKMHHTAADARRFAETFASALSTSADAAACEIVICPPFTSLSALAEAMAGSAVALGAQNVHWEETGAFTGEVSPAMLAEFGCKYVIVGHSERRTLFGETDDAVRRKVVAVLSRGMTPIVCVGETAEERAAGETDRVVGGQIRAAIDPLSPEETGRLVVAYEPIWAIGTGATATAQDADETIGAVRETIRREKGEAAADRVRIQYGGSVKPANIRSFCEQPQIDGALVGGASLDADSFAQIVHGWRG